MCVVKPQLGMDGTDSNPTSHAATPTAAFAPQMSGREGSGLKVGNKKKRPTEKDDDEDGKVKRSKITYARD